MWMLPASTSTFIRHFMQKPRDGKLAMRHSACGRTFLVGEQLEHDGAAPKCGTCKRLTERHGAGRE